MKSIQAAIDCLHELKDFKDKGVEWEFLKSMFDPATRDSMGNAGYFADAAGYMIRLDKKNNRALPGENKKISVVIITPKYQEDLALGGAPLIRQQLLMAARLKSAETAKVERCRRNITFPATTRKDEFNRDLYTLSEVAEMLRVSTQTITNATAKGIVREKAKSVDQTVTRRTHSPRLFYHRNQVPKIAAALEEMKNNNRLLNSPRAAEIRSNEPETSDELMLVDEVAEPVKLAAPVAAKPAALGITLLKPGEISIVGNKIYVNGNSVNIIQLKPGEHIIEDDHTFVAVL